MPVDQCCQIGAIHSRFLGFGGPCGCGLSRLNVRVPQASAGYFFNAESGERA
jgi:hypothetical protein